MGVAPGGVNELLKYNDMLMKLEPTSRETENERSP